MKKVALVFVAAVSVLLALPKASLGWGETCSVASDRRSMTCCGFDNWGVWYCTTMVCTPVGANDVTCSENQTYDPGF